MKKLDKTIPAYLTETDESCQQVMRYQKLSNSDTKTYYKLMESEDWTGLGLYQNIWVKKYFNANPEHGFFGIAFTKNNPENIFNSIASGEYQIETHECDNNLTMTLQ